MGVTSYIGKSLINLTIGLPITAIESAYNAGQTVVGVAASALSIATLGTVPKINDVAKLTSRSYTILPDLYKIVTRVVNPYSKLGSASRMGVITNTIAIPIFNKALSSARVNTNYNPVSSFFKKHIISRLAFAIFIPVATVTRTTDLALGVIAATVSLIPCLGMSKRINNFVMKELTFLDIVDDVCLALRGFVNPQQFFNK